MLSSNFDIALSRDHSNNSTHYHALVVLTEVESWDWPHLYCIQDLASCVQGGKNRVVIVK